MDAGSVTYGYCSASTGYHDEEKYHEGSWEELYREDAILFTCKGTICLLG